MFRPLLISLFLTSTAVSATWTVDDDGKADFDNIQAAVNAASDGDEIIVMPGTYTSTQDGHVVNTLGKSVWLHSLSGSEVTTINGEFSRRGIACFNGENSKTIIEGFTIKDCLSVPFDYDGDGDANEYWEADVGGGMYLMASPTITNCVFTSNTANSAGGGGISIFSSPNLVNCQFDSNYAGYGGGAIELYGGYPSLQDCVFENNSVGGASYGSVLNAYSGSSFENCVVRNNSKGICVWHSDSYGDPTLTNSTLCGNSGYQITGDYVDGGGNTIATVCPDQECPDINGDGYVNVTDILALISAWHCVDCDDEDVNADGIVNVSDLLLVISNWGPCE